METKATKEQEIELTEAQLEIVGQFNDYSFENPNLHKSLSPRQNIFGPHADNFLGVSLCPIKFRESRYPRLKTLSIGVQFPFP